MQTGVLGLPVLPQRSGPEGASLPVPLGSFPALLPSLWRPAWVGGLGGVWIVVPRPATSQLGALGHSVTWLLPCDTGILLLLQGWAAHRVTVMVLAKLLLSCPPSPVQTPRGPDTWERSPPGHSGTVLGKRVAIPSATWPGEHLSRQPILCPASWPARWAGVPVLWKECAREATGLSSPSHEVVESEHHGLRTLHLEGAQSFVLLGSEVGE